MNMKKEITKYGLLHKETNRIVGYDIQSNEGKDCCVSNQYILNNYSDNMWLVNTIEEAEYVKRRSTEWYNADYNTPTHDYDENEIEIVKVESSITITPIK